jgi:ACS family glucarate transporter-like MFS transporter
MGRVFSAFLLGYALCQIPAGKLADRFGAPRVLRWAAYVAFIFSVPMERFGSS